MLKRLTKRILRWRKPEPNLWVRELALEGLEYASKVVKRM